MIVISRNKITTSQYCKCAKLHRSECLIPSFIRGLLHRHLISYEYCLNDNITVLLVRYSKLFPIIERTPTTRGSNLYLLLQPQCLSKCWRDNKHLLALGLPCQPQSTSINGVNMIKDMTLTFCYLKTHEVLQPSFKHIMMLQHKNFQLTLLFSSILWILVFFFFVCFFS